VAEAINFSRVTTSKYLQVLAAKEFLEVREVGRAKLHYISKSAEADDMEVFS
jgi:response regulator of citrate/malate metabolism